MKLLSPHSTFGIRQPTGKAAFTIVEILVSMVVLTLLIAMVAQIVSSATIVTTGSRKHMDTDSQARSVFDRLSGDLGKMVKRTDVDYLFSKQTGSGGNAANDLMFFYSEAPAFWNGASNSVQQSSMALLGYRINAAYQMERLGKLLSLDGAVASATPGGMVYLAYPAPTAASPSPTPLPASLLENIWTTTLGTSGTNPPYNGTDNDYHVLGEGIYRLEYCFQLKSFTNSTGVVQPAIYSNTPYDTRNGHTSIYGNGLNDVAAIVVTLAILDTTSRKVLPPVNLTINSSPVTSVDLSKLVNAFSDPTDAELAPTLATTPPTLMAAKWKSQLEANNFASTAGIPQSVASQIRIYQRYFPLNTK